MTAIAIIDDEPLVGRSFGRLLELEGYESSYYESAESFLDSGVCREAQCLLVDYQLPGLSGCDLVRKLRGEGVATPVVLMSGNVDGVINSMLAEFDHVETLDKPCLPKILYEAIALALASANPPHDG